MVWFPDVVIAFLELCILIFAGNRSWVRMWKNLDMEKKLHLVHKQREDEAEAKGITYDELILQIKASDANAKK